MSQRDEIENARVSYEQDALDEASLASDPITQFQSWLAEAFAAGSVVEPNAMTLATVGEDGRPSARIVLLRGCDARGLAFFTNYESRKARELATHSAAALVFFWGALQRQVRVEGAVERLPAEESDAYFSTRPRGHRLSAWSSPQSEAVASRGALETAFADTERRFAGRDVERPPFWGGFRLVPDRFEFWQGRLNRAHDRLAYLRDAEGWRIVRLAP